TVVARQRAVGPELVAVGVAVAVSVVAGDGQNGARDGLADVELLLDGVPVGVAAPGAGPFEVADTARVQVLARLDVVDRREVVEVERARVCRAQQAESDRDCQQRDPLPHGYATSV